MTNPILRDPEQNRAYYAHRPEYKREPAILQEQRMKLVAAWLRGRKTILDVGCNDGVASELIPPDADYTGLELNEVAIENAWPRAKGRILRVDATTFAYPGNTYDAVLTLEVLEHVIDPLALLGRIRPTLTPNGIIVSTSASGAGEHSAEPTNTEHLREWTLGEFVKLHEDAGYVVLQAALAHVHTRRFTNSLMAAVNR